MPFDKQKVLERIAELNDKCKGAAKNRGQVEEVFFGTITLVEAIYGKNSPQIKSLFETKKAWTKSGYAEAFECQGIINSVQGILKSAQADIEAGLIQNIERAATGEVFGNFIVSAKSSIDNGYKDVAAVLACAAIEDALKRLATFNGLKVETKNMSAVINALKSREILKGPQASIVSSYVKLRNKAFHAEWDKIAPEDVKSLIAFTEEFIIRNFS